MPERPDGYFVKEKAHQGRSRSPMRELYQVTAATPFNEAVNVERNS
jgi:hypothetical protein